MEKPGKGFRHLLAVEVGAQAKSVEPVVLDMVVMAPLLLFLDRQ
jgi:hypothetical protein